MAVNRKVDGSNPSGRVFRPITSYWLAHLIMSVSACFGDHSFTWSGSDGCVTWLGVGLILIKVILRIEWIDMEIGVILGRYGLYEWCGYWHLWYAVCDGCVAGNDGGWWGGGCKFDCCCLWVICRVMLSYSSVGRACGC